MTIDRRPGIPTIRVISTAVGHHMVVADLLRFAGEVQQAVREGLDPQARLNDHHSTEMHLIQLSVDSEAVDPLLCGISFVPPADAGVLRARCKLPKGHDSTIHSVDPPEDETP